MNPAGKLPSEEDLYRPFSGSLPHPLSSCRSQRSASSFSLVSSASSESEEAFYWRSDLEDCLKDQKICGVYYEILKAMNHQLLQGNWDAVVEQTITYCTQVDSKEGLRYLAFALFSGARHIPDDPFQSALALFFIDDEVNAEMIGRLLKRCFEDWKVQEPKDQPFSGEPSRWVNFSDPTSEKSRCWHVGGGLVLSALTRCFTGTVYREGMKLETRFMPRSVDDCASAIDNSIYKNFDVPVMMTAEVPRACLIQNKDGSETLPIVMFNELDKCEFRKLQTDALPVLSRMLESEMKEVAGDDEQLLEVLIQVQDRLNEQRRERAKRQVQQKRKTQSDKLSKHSDGDLLRRAVKKNFGHHLHSD